MSDNNNNDYDYDYDDDYDYDCDAPNSDRFGFSHHQHTEFPMRFDTAYNEIHMKTTKTLYNYL